MKKTCRGSVRASSPPFGGYREKQTRETHARGDAKAGGFSVLARSRTSRFARPNRRACSQSIVPGRRVTRQPE